VELLGRDREAALGGNRDKGAEILQLHRLEYNAALFNLNKYKLDRYLPKRYKVPGSL
jgi:hypothetical protein